MVAPYCRDPPLSGGSSSDAAALELAVVPERPSLTRSSTAPTTLRRSTRGLSIVVPDAAPAGADDAPPLSVHGSDVGGPVAVGADVEPWSLSLPAVAPAQAGIGDEAAKPDDAFATPPTSPASPQCAAGSALVAGWFRSPSAASPVRPPRPRASLPKAASLQLPPLAAAPPGVAALRAPLPASPPVTRRLTRTGSHVALEDCELLEQVGAGSEGVVWRARWRGAPVAVKLWHDARLTEPQLANICREARCVVRAWQRTH